MMYHDVSWCIMVYHNINVYYICKTFEQNIANIYVLITIND